ncbi:MAG: nucleoside triphosphate pyrophosphohydrolase [Alphaproteobacteria bacterium]|nr:nucleoside triphosphate pyrophosphohydrolase [Alphaproteobacteria bacterium]
MRTFEKLVHIMERLRLECPWDKEQNFKTLRNMTIEELYEFIAELDAQNMQGMREELGDLLLHIVFYSKLADEQHAFNIYDVIESINEKLIRRHPHIFGEKKLINTENVLLQWQKIKRQEGKKSCLEGIPVALPTILKAELIQKKAAQVGFDWKKVEDVWAKTKEEEQEFKDSILENDRDAMEAELGDWFFSLVNLARFYNLNPETALERTNQKFMKRFQFMETHCHNNNLDMSKLSLETLESLWITSKKDIQ